MELWVARGVPATTRIGSVADVLEHAETLELMHRVEEGLLVSQIQVQPIEYDEWTVSPNDLFIMNAEIDWDIAMQSAESGDPMMRFAWEGTHYKYWIFFGVVQNTCGTHHAAAPSYTG